MACLSQWECSNSPKKRSVIVPLACMCAELQKERINMMVLSGGSSLLIIDTAALHCDQALFLAVFLHVI